MQNETKSTMKAREKGTIIAQRIQSCKEYQDSTVGESVPQAACYKKMPMVHASMLSTSGSTCGDEIT